ncbi:hypothetical protein FYJ58_09200 [Lachnospiraceae bacterium WCA-693-APC-MOT-I]|uniref:Flagellin n=2 Tax=Velocimicrobium porci TaxID=2606634 RepID=A0A6L5XYW9_9FIRM|nr:hypothetical protein [Velocimicrobium porci]
MIIQHNMQAANANRMLGNIVTNQSKSTEKLSSGYRINRAGDDAAGLAISEKMRGQIRGLTKASTNAQDGISMIQTAEGALTETHSILQRMRELSVQAANDTNTDDDRTQIQNEIDKLTQEVDRIANTTEFNTKKLLDGSRQGSVNEKAGSTNIDGTFGNGNVSAAITTDGSAKAAFTDVIRIEVTQDFTDGQSTKGTSKLSNEQINKINQLITTAGAVTLDPVLQEAAGVSITGVYSADKSTEENIAGALGAAKGVLSTLESAAATSSTAVSENKEAVVKTVDNILKLAEITKAANGDTFLKAGVTKEDLTNAVNKYIDALVKDGKAAGAGDSNEIKAANTELKGLFDTANTQNIGKAVAATSVDVAAKHKKGDGTDVALVQSGALATTDNLSKAATDTFGLLDTFAKSVASTAITNNVNQAKVAQVQDVVDVLGNTELATAIVDYKKAVSDKAAADANANATDKLKEEAQAKVDSTKAQLDKLNTDKSVIDVKDLFGNTADSAAFKISDAVDKNNELKITLKNKSGDDTVITISNANKLKAGDVLTITSDAMVESKQAETGKDAFHLQVGANAGQEVALGINSMKAKDLNIVQTKDGVEGESLKVTSQADASLAVKAYDMAIQKVSTERAKMGATQNRLEHTIANLDTSAENLQSAESRIRDVNMAKEMVDYSKNNILQQAAQSMLAQANQSTQGVLSLLR